MRCVRFMVILFVLFTASLAQAEEIHLKDGSVVNGTFQSLVGGNVNFKTGSVGTLTIPAANITSFLPKPRWLLFSRTAKQPMGNFL